MALTSHPVQYLLVVLVAADPDVLGVVARKLHQAEKTEAEEVCR